MTENIDSQSKMPAVSALVLGPILSIPYCACGLVRGITRRDLRETRDYIGDGVEVMRSAYDDLFSQKQ